MIPIQMDSVIERRAFLRVAGGVSVAVLAGCRTAGIGGVRDGGGSMFIDGDEVRGRNHNRSTVVGRHGMVCTNQPLASMAALDILKNGGNAIDAAVCANAMQCLTEPMSCGPGGDLFAIVWHEKDRKLYGLNASGRSPYDWNLEAARKLGLSVLPLNGPLAWSVPGCVSGWDALLSRFGNRKLSDVLEAPIQYAREGFPVAPVAAGYWQFDFSDFPTLAKTYAPDGKPPRFGDIFKNEGLADFFSILARDGARAFYEGEIAERIVAFSKKNSGKFSIRDFTDHTATWVDPVSANYRGYDVWEIPPNGQGIATLQILNILNEFDIGALSPNSAEHLHLFIEAKRLAFEDRARYYADQEFSKVPVAELISKEYAKKRAKLIDPKRAAKSVAAGNVPTGPDTIYLTVADDEGNMVSLIQSTYYGFGSKIVPAGLGFALQNRGAAFALDPDHPNRLEPHKRPFHTIIPAFVTKDSDPVFSFGVMGGPFQPQGQAQVFMNLVDFGMSPQQAGDQPRISHDGSSEPNGVPGTGVGTITCERRISPKVKKALAEMGHKISDGTRAYGGYQGIWRKEDPRRYFGGSDPRKDGLALGY